MENFNSISHCIAFLHESRELYSFSKTDVTLYFNNSPFEESNGKERKIVKAIVYLQNNGRNVRFIDRPF